MIALRVVVVREFPHEPPKVPLADGDDPIEAFRLD
jgi:hypothetical protein